MTHRAPRLLFAALLSAVLPLAAGVAPAGELPRVTRHDVRFSDGNVSVAVAWQSTEPVVKVRVLVGGQQKEGGVDPYDNHRNAAGYEGTANLAFAFPLRGAQEWLPYSLQLEDELHRQSEPVTGRVAVLPGSRAAPADDRWGSDQLPQTPAWRGKPQTPGGLLDKVLDAVQSSPGARIDAVSYRLAADGSVIFVIKATDLSAARNVVFDLYDGADQSVLAEPYTIPAKGWDGTTAPFPLPPGPYRLVVRAVDDSGKRLAEAPYTFSLSGAEKTKSTASGSGTSAAVRIDPATAETDASGRVNLTIPISGLDAAHTVVVNLYDSARRALFQEPWAVPAESWNPAVGPLALDAGEYILDVAVVDGKGAAVVQRQDRFSVRPNQAEPAARVQIDRVAVNEEPGGQVSVTIQGKDLTGAGSLVLDLLDESRQSLLADPWVIPAASWGGVTAPFELPPGRYRLVVRVFARDNSLAAEAAQDFEVAPAGRSALPESSRGAERPTEPAAGSAPSSPAEGAPSTDEHPPGTSGPATRPDAGKEPLQRDPSLEGGTRGAPAAPKGTAPGVALPSGSGQPVVGLRRLTQTPSRPAAGAVEEPPVQQTSVTASEPAAPGGPNGGSEASKVPKRPALLKKDTPR